MRIAEWSLHFYRLPYRRPVRWFNSTESEATCVLLRTVADNGATGVAEAPLKPTWSGASPRSIAAVLDDLLLPAVQEVDAADPDAVSRQLARYPENHLAKALVDNACATMRAAAAGKPLWQLLNGKPAVELSWCVTRQAPDAMAREAAEVVERHGFRALKIKGGQGTDIDRTALQWIRAAVGDAVHFYVDANGAYAREAAADYVRMIAAEGAKVAEDPCDLHPDDAFTALCRASEIPILVDSNCTSPRDARQFLDRGATALTVKPGRIGITEAMRVAEIAAQRGANVCSGMYAESALGTLISLQMSSALPAPMVPSEQSFYLMMTEQVLCEPLEIRDGHAQLPPRDMARLVDWERVKRLSSQS
jgi:L-Ala-D/L-Glu epimerase